MVVVSKWVIGGICSDWDLRGSCEIVAFLPNLLASVDGSRSAVGDLNNYQPAVCDNAESQLP